jgi:DDE superfamily endonuclease
LPPECARLAGDETDLRLFPPLRAGWVRRGQPAPVPISGGNAKRVLFGAINLGTGRRLFQVRQRQCGADAAAFLAEVRRHYRGRPVALLGDEDPSHTAAVCQAAAAELGIEVLWLPTRSPHLNPMDHLWRHGKAVMSANHQYDSIDTQAADFITYLGGLPAVEALRKAGLLSEDFWLNQ